MNHPVKVVYIFTFPHQSTGKLCLIPISVVAHFGSAGRTKDASFKASHLHPTADFHVVCVYPFQRSFCFLASNEWEKLDRSEDGPEELEEHSMVAYQVSLNQSCSSIDVFLWCCGTNCFVAVPWETICHLPPKTWLHFRHDICMWSVKCFDK